MVLRAGPRTSGASRLPPARQRAGLADRGRVRSRAAAGPARDRPAAEERMIAIVVHGGAGRWPAEAREAALEGVARAVETGHAVLAAGGDALAAGQAAGGLLGGDPGVHAGPGPAPGRH